jgi:glycosyltransferase involved in cell wall biosynthesis
MGLKIDLLCNDGSPIGIIPADIEGRGVGGAELSMLTLMDVFAKRGHEVTVYNNPKTPGVYNGVTFANLDNYNNRHPKDVVIVFRSPNKRYDKTQMPKTVKKIWWSTDQFTVGSFSALAQTVDHIVTISPHHTAYFQSNYSISAKKMTNLDLGVRLSEYDQEIEKIKGRLIFCSIPDRGLPILHAAWALIKRDVPDASLAITSDYTLWGVSANNSQHRLQWAGKDDVHFLGKVPRSRLVKLQLQSEIMAYPSVYEELFCISAAECQVSGAVPVTSAAGALPTTNEFGIILPGNPKTATWVDAFSGRIAALLTHERDYLEQRQKTMTKGARQRFDWNKIADKWEEIFEEDYQ